MVSHACKAGDCIHKCSSGLRFFTDYLERAIDKFVSAAEDFDKRVKSVDVTEEVLSFKKYSTLSSNNLRLQIHVKPLILSKELRPLHTTHETAKSADIFHTHHKSTNFFYNCNDCSNSFTNGQQFSQ